VTRTTFAFLDAAFGPELLCVSESGGPVAGLKRMEDVRSGDPSTRLADTCCDWRMLGRSARSQPSSTPIRNLAVRVRSSCSMLPRVRGFA
jgi:hypothetical protein